MARTDCMAKSEVMSGDVKKLSHIDCQTLSDLIDDACLATTSSINEYRALKSYLQSTPQIQKEFVKNVLIKGKRALFFEERKLLVYDKVI